MAGRRSGDNKAVIPLPSILSDEIKPGPKLIGVDASETNQETQKVTNAPQMTGRWFLVMENTLRPANGGSVVPLS